MDVDVTSFDFAAVVGGAAVAVEPAVAAEGPRLAARLDGRGGLGAIP